MEASVVRGYPPPGLPVEILARVPGVQPLTQRVQHVVPTTRLVTGIADQPGNPGSQAESAILFAHQPPPFAVCKADHPAAQCVMGGVSGNSLSIHLLFSHAFFGLVYLRMKLWSVCANCRLTAVSDRAVQTEIIIRIWKTMSSCR